jgi:hypothetical protein
MKGLIERQIWYSGCPDDDTSNADGGKKDEENREKQSYTPMIRASG